MLKSATFLVKVFKNALKLSDSQRDIHCTLREHYPLQQGLRPNCEVVFHLFLILREHYPLQQGLRRLHIFDGILMDLREHYPLQQGLRHPIIEGKCHLPTSQRALSITTRIKTQQC